MIRGKPIVKVMEDSSNSSSSVFKSANEERETPEELDSSELSSNGGPRRQGGMSNIPQIAES